MGERERGLNMRLLFKSIHNSHGDTLVVIDEAKSYGMGDPGRKSSIVAIHEQFCVRYCWPHTRRLSSPKLIFKK